MGENNLYDEIHRPQFHFTAKKGWLNDPNGLMFCEGEYHLFLQHNPEGTEWGNMTWAHAVSGDMVHWTQLDHAIYPDNLGTIFSGSGVVDHNNTAGWQSGDEKVMVCIYTSAGTHVQPQVDFTQSVAYSNDRGRTWTKYAGNPVLGHVIGSNRDPKVIWHGPTGKWVMALYLDEEEYAIFTSPDLKNWTRTCTLTIGGCSECPDLFELPVDPPLPGGSDAASDDETNTKWVFWGGNGNYLLGSFDGETFTPESGPHQSNWGGNCYAAQTWSDIPSEDGRRLQIAWMSGGKYPDMPFNQQMSFPVELTLRTTPDGPRLGKMPVREIAGIRAKTHSWADTAITPGENLLSEVSGELFDIRAEIEIGDASEVGFTLRGQKVQYDVAAATVTCLDKTAPLAPVEGRITLRILLDRTSIEVFGNNGTISMPTCFLPDATDRGIAIYAAGGEARVVSMDVHELKSAWGK